MEQLVCMNTCSLMDLHTQRFKMLRTSLYPDLVPDPSHVSNPFEATNHNQSIKPRSTTDEDMFYECVEDTSGLTLDFSMECPNYLINCAEYELDLGTDPSLPGLNAAMNGVNFLDCLRSSSLERFPVIFDSGASVAISGNKGDFVGDIIPPFRELTLGGMAKGTKVEGIGLVHWTFHNGRETLTLALKCYYVPNCKVRLLFDWR
jgi:hypothetical protein